MLRNTIEDRSYLVLEEQPSMQSYTFSYLVTKNHADITDDGQLVIKMGLRKKSLPLNSLRGLYIKHNESSSTEELILGYEPQPGKKKKIRIYADEDSKELRELADELCRRCPAIVDLRSRPEKEALKELKAADIEKVALLATPFIILAVVGVMLLPQLIHGLDSGHAELDVAELEAARFPDTRNLSLTGLPLNAGVVVSTTRKGSTTKRVFLPLVSSSWNKTKPITVLLKSDELSEADFNQLLRSRKFEVILRNVLWEGPGSKEMDFLEKEYGFRFTENPLLVEIREESSISDLSIWILVMATTALIMFAVTGVFWYFRYREK